MICAGDRDYCGSDCTHTPCRRHQFHVPDVPLPVSLAPFHLECPDYRPPETESGEGEAES